MRDIGATVRHPLHIVLIEPDAVSAGKVLTDQPKIIEMGGQRLAVAFQAGDRLKF